MSTTTRSSAQRSRPTSPYDDDVVITQEETLSSDHEEDPEVSFHPHQFLQLPSHLVGQPLPAAGMYMPYIEGPHMDWTVNDHLYHRFLKWHLKCKNILEYKLAALLGVPAVQEGNCMEQRLQNGPICVLESVLK